MSGGGSFSFFFVEQKTAYEMRISDWSSDVCSSDLLGIVLADPGSGEGPDDAPAFEVGQNDRAVLAQRYQNLTRPTLWNAGHGLVQHIGRIGVQVVAVAPVHVPGRSEEGRVGKECVSKVRSRWSPE